MRLVKTQKSRFVRRQPNAAMPKAISHNRHSCAEEISTAWSPSWATGFGARCSSYESCFASSLSRHSDAVREAEASVVRWQKSWLAAARMECMAKAIDGSGAVDQAKMHACNGKNITDMSFFNFTIEKPPTMDVCPTPEIYPGSLYREEVYGKLPAGLSVRQPTPCLLSLCSTVDLEETSPRCANSGNHRYHHIQQYIVHVGGSRLRYVDRWKERCTCVLVGCSKRRDVHVRGRLSAGQRGRKTHCLRVSVRWS